MTTQYVYQAPLTHKTHGPGLILVLSDHYSDAGPRNRPLHLDPPPVQKWAEEGFCVLGLIVPSETQGETVKEKWGEVLTQGLGSLKGKAELEGERFGMIVYESNLASDILSEPVLPRELCSIVVHLDQSHIPNSSSVACPQLWHVSTLGLDVGQPLVEISDQANEPEGSASSITTYKYAGPTQGSSGVPSSFIHPSSPGYNHTYATLAHTRTLTFLRSHVGGPVFDIEAIWEAHTRFEFERRDVEATMATMVEEPYVNHIPTLTGGIGRTALTSFYAHHFICANPASTRMELVSRTIGPDRVVDEFVFEFVHDMEMDWMLPGVPPTGKHVRVPFVAVVNVRGDKLYHEHIYWDQASVLVQIGLLPQHLAFPGSSKEIRLPAVGVDQAEKMLDPGARESNLLIQRGKAEKEAILQK
ncbi:hypothetical protein FS749_016725 [Ceratobasidium sp. UAMH 11750]|nr:hypothetical protein FS749_016725 [Ceratobasidium sp. UAMH 11750]